VSTVAVRDLGMQPLETVWADMKRFTELRDERTPDEIWFLEHPPVFTLGLRGDRRHLFATGDIPVVAIDRGGQVTFHGPGQLIVYPLLDLKRLGLGVRALVRVLEAAVIETVAAYGIAAEARRDAPGVYVDGRKIAALGLRVRRNCSYHGLAVNVSMDLAPFSGIHPCGFKGLEVTQLADLNAKVDMPRFRADLEPVLLSRLGLSAA
jgi:lipoyl(octanoyl) transferase